MTDAGPEVMARSECVELLRRQRVGRLAVVTEAGSPLIFPVNFAATDEAVVFRTSPGTKLDLARGREVAFEVDEIDLARRRGWSVVVVGAATELTSAEVADMLAQLGGVGPEPMAAGSRDQWVKVVIGMISGRRVGPEDLPFAFHGRGYI